MSKLATCNTESEIISNGGLVVENNDGTVSVYMPNSVTGVLTQLPLTKPCCEALRTPSLFFDKATQKCYWSSVNTNIPFNIVLNPKGNDGTIFLVEPDEECTLSVEFDYLFKFSGSTLTDLANGILESECKLVTDVFESLGASAVISTVKPTNSGTLIQPVYEEVVFSAIGSGNLYDYLNGKSATTGFYVTCTSTNNGQEYPIDLYNLTVNNNTLNCPSVVNQITTTLFNQSGLQQNTIGVTEFRTKIDKGAFASDWLRASFEISDPVAISAMTNERIKLNIRLSGVCVDFCVLVDNIELNKNCRRVTSSSIFITKSPGFELDRIIDNKKSWINNTERTHRTFKISKYDNTKSIRYTDYYLDDYRQVINTKEIDLDINIASAVETDVWGYMVDNPCLLTGVTIGTTTKSKDTLQTITGTAIQTIFSTSNVVVYTACTVNVTSSTTISNPAITAYTCPAGFTATPANDECQYINIVQASAPAVSPAIISAGNRNQVYGRRGAWFYPAITAGSNLPYRVNPSTEQLNDSIGNIITPTVINTTYPFWASNNSNTIGGRLNNIGLLAPTDTDTGSGLAGWVGFSKCLNIETAGTYYVGLAADNYCNFKVNGNLIAAFTALTTFSFNVWHVFPITLNSGLNFIEMEGLNGGNDSAFGAEIYYPTGATPFATLTAATSTASTQANAIFSTAEYIGGNWEIGGGYTCPTGYILSYCEGPTPTCVRRITEPITVTITPVKDTVITVVIPSATTCPGQSAITVSSTATTITSTTACLPQEYCASEYCGDENINIRGLLTQPLSLIQTVEDFQYYLTSELIDAKNRKIISSYATLRLLYERYMNSVGRCTVPSAKFDYYSMNRFANLVGNYWVDLIEQVVPATTIWGSTRVYGNTLFDNQKFKYKPYSTQFGENKFGLLQPSSPATGRTCNTSATTKTIFGNASGSTLFTNQGNEATFSSVYLMQYNSGSQYFGSVKIIGVSSPCGKDGQINNCDLAVQIEDNIIKDGTLKAIPISPIGNVSYNWVTPVGNFTTQTIAANSSGTYTVTIQDDCCEATATLNRGNCNLSVALTSTNPDTAQNNGSITATPSGQAGVVSYLWSNGSTTQTITNLSAGTYDVTVTDTAFDSCIATATTTLYETFSLRAESVTGASIYNIVSTSNYDIVWGDGVVSAYTAGNNFMSSGQGHIYQAPNTPYTGNINIRSLNLSGITRILTNFGGASGGTNARLVFSASQLSQLISLGELQVINAHLSGNTADLPDSLTRLVVNNGRLFGSTYGLPTGMTFISLTLNDSNIISGDTLGLPRTLTGMTILGQNTITGNVSGYPTGLTSMSIAGNNTVFGNVIGIPRRGVTMTFAGSAALTGNIGNIPTGTTQFISQSRDNISGDVSTLSAFTQLRTLVVENDEIVTSLGTGNTINGDINNLPKGITFLNIAGFNTISGNISNMITGSTAQTGYFNIRGNNTVTGNISGASNNFINFILGGSSSTLSGDTAGIPSNIQIMLIGGQNTLSGDLGSINSGVTFVDIGGRNSIDTYTGKTWTNGLNRLRITASTVYNTGYTTVQLDQLLNDLTGYTWANNSSFALFTRFGRPIITLIGTASTASAAARVKLSGSTGSGGFNINLTLV